MTLFFENVFPALFVRCFEKGRKIVNIRESTKFDEERVFSGGIVNKSGWWRNAKSRRPSCSVFSLNS